VISELVERRLVALLGHPRCDPYGNPIPGLEEIGGVAAPAFMTGVVPVADAVPARGGVSVTIRRLGEPLQVEPDQLKRLRDAGVVPGAVAEARRDGEAVRLAVAGAAPLVLAPEAAAHVFVAAG
jgi:DtxR family Mn-dependent transcriptional regulator